MKNSTLFKGIVAVSAAIAINSQANAAFNLFENFDSLADGALNGQGPAGNLWSANSVASVLNPGGGDKLVSLAPGATGTITNYRSLVTPGLSILNSSVAATVYWNFMTSAAGSANNWNFIVTDVAAPADTAGSSEVQFNFDGSQAAVRANDGNTFRLLSLDGTVAGRFLPLINVFYRAWFEINNSTDTYQVFLQSDGDARVATRTLMRSDGNLQTFKFRNSNAAVQANDLTTINFGSGVAAGGATIQFDNIYVDTAGFNSANPAIPEPASSALLLGGIAGICGFRRRRG